MCKAIQDSLLRKTCAEAAKTLMGLLNSGSDSTNSSLTKSVITCLGRLLRAQSYDSWSTDSIRHVYRHVLRFVDSEKPSIRKSSHLAIIDILGSFNMFSITEEINFHPACHQTQEHLCSVIRQELRQLITSLHTKDVHCTRLLHCLHLLTSVIPLLPSKDVKLTYECILEMANFPNPLVVTKMFHSFQTLFDSKPSLKTLPIDIAARLLTALYSCRPNDPNVFTLSTVDSNTSCTGVDAVISWVQALISGCAYLSGLSLLATETEDIELKQKIGNVGRFSIQQLANEHLDRLVKTLMSLLATTPLPQLREAITQKLNQVFIEIVDPQLASCQLAELLPNFIPDILSSFINGLQYIHYEIWHHLLCIIGRFIMIISKVSASCLTANLSGLMELLKVVIHLRDCLVDGPKNLTNLIHIDPKNFSLIGLGDLGEKIIDGLDSVCLLTVEYLGPEFISSENIFSLETVVGELEVGKIDLQRSWFLPLLARAVPQKSCSLSIFRQHILPLADRALLVASSTAALSDKSRPANNALITSGIKVACQLWSSLKMFVHRSPCDWSELSTGGLGCRLVKELNTAPALRPVILHAFRRLAKLAADDDSAVTVMRGGAKMALPAILSLYETLDTSTQHALKQKIQATLSCYLPILSPKMISSLTKTAMLKFENTKQPVYLEIFQILAPYNSVDDMKRIINRINEYLNVEQLSKPLRKRVFRVFESICAGSTDQTDEFLNSHLNDVIQMVYSLTKKPVNTLPITKTTTVAEVLGATTTKDDNTTISTTESIEEKLTTLSVCEMKLDTQENKTHQLFIPWKPLLRCIHHLFKRLVTCELDGATNANLNNTVHSGDLMENDRLREFANMFLPEILTCMQELNRTVRDLAGRLLIGLVNAFAGQQPFDKNSKLLSSSLYGSRSNLTLDNRSSRPPSIMNSIMKDSESEDEDVDNDDVHRDNKSVVSLGGLTYSDGDEDEDIMSTKSMPRGSEISERICRALNLVLSRLWPCLPPHNRCASNPVELALQQSSARAICLLMKHMRFRQALILNINSESDVICQLVSTLLSEVNLIGRSLVESPHRVLIRLGLQLSRSLIIFIREGSISLTSVLETLQSIHPSCKRPLRFVVKSILEKMMKKFGRQAIQNLLNAEHQKIVRNSAKLIARRERKAKVLNKGSTSKSTTLSSVGSMHQPTSDDSDSNHNSQKSILNDIKSVQSSSHSKSLSSAMPKRVHVTRMDELLASSSDEDNDFFRSKSQSDSSSVHSRAKSIRSQTKSQNTLSSKQPMSLVEELENIKRTAGLCRRSRRNVIQNGSLEDAGMDIDVDSSEDDEQINKELIKHPFRSKHKVRFADTVSRASTTRSQLSRRSQMPLFSSSSHHPTPSDSDLWLVENPNDAEILDLSDPKSLARHTAFAPDDTTAKAMVSAFRNSLTQQSKSESLESGKRSQPFPILDGKIIIGATNEIQHVKRDGLEWALADDDDANNSRSAGPHVNDNKTKPLKGRRHKSLQIPGSIYASVKARGDMKRSGMPEPYAFVPLGAGIGKSGDSTSQKITPLERRRLLREVGMGRQKRKRCQGNSKGAKLTMKSDRKFKFSKLSKI
ncbi:unnamed protein product [Heterobilharzia americana]|nr:unnamed protein product [Heterobilharzia americana]